MSKIKKDYFLFIIAILIAIKYIFNDRFFLPKVFTGRTAYFIYCWIGSFSEIFM